MERLTEYLGGIPHIKRTINGINSKANYLRDFDIEAVKKLAAYEDTGMEPEEVKAKCAWADNVCKMLSGIFEDSGVFDFSHIKELITAEQEGRLIVLPCKVGDVVYEIGYDCKIDYEDMCAFPAPSCDECEFVKRVIVPVRVDSVTAATFLIGKIGTTAFFSFEEAEAALKGVSDDA